MQISEGIGQGRVTENLNGWGLPKREGGVVDFWTQVEPSYDLFVSVHWDQCNKVSDGSPAHSFCTNPAQVSDEEALPIVYDLLKEEGFCFGGSTGINVGGTFCYVFLYNFLNLFVFPPSLPPRNNVGSNWERQCLTLQELWNWRRSWAPGIQLWLFCVTWGPGTKARYSM